MTETGHNMDENDVPENCMEASAEADYRDFFNFYADQVSHLVNVRVLYLPIDKIHCNDIMVQVMVIHNLLLGREAVLHRGDA